MSAHARARTRVHVHWHTRTHTRTLQGKHAANVKGWVFILLALKPCTTPNHAVCHRPRACRPAVALDLKDAILNVQQWHVKGARNKQ